MHPNVVQEGHAFARYYGLQLPSLCQALCPWDFRRAPFSAYKYIFIT